MSRPLSPTCTRRRWLALSLAGAGQLAMTRHSAAMGLQGTRPTWGVQLYTVRDLIARAPESTLRALADIGYRELEVLQPTLPIVGPIAEKLGLAIVSAHLDAKTSTGDGLAAFITQARDRGLRYLVIPYVPPAERPTDRAGFERIAARVARIGDEVARAGMQLCYHNHAFEFGKDSGGTRWLEVLMRATSASQVRLELDVFWVAITGTNPLDVIRQYSGRIALMHLKDKAPKAPASLVESEVARETFLEVGSGALDFPAILSASRAAGVAHYFVEQDHTPGDPIASLKKSHEFLRGVKS